MYVLLCLVGRTLWGYPGMYPSMTTITIFSTRVPQSIDIYVYRFPVAGRHAFRLLACIDLEICATAGKISTAGGPLQLDKTSSELPCVAQRAKYCLQRGTPCIPYGIYPLVVGAILLV